MSWIFSKVLMDSLSLPCSQEQVVESLLQKDLESEPSVQLSVSTTQHPFLHNGKIQETSNLSRFGLTSRALTEKHGEELILLAAASHAKIYQLRASKQGSQEKGQGFGLRWQESLQKSSQDLFSSKTYQPLENTLDISCTTLPPSGTMRNGAVSAQKKLGDYIKEIECGFLLGTPTTVISPRSEKFKKGRVPSPVEFVKDFPIATSHNAKKGGLLDGKPDNETFFHTPNTSGLDGGSNSRRALKKRLEIWHTPLSSDTSGGMSTNSRGEPKLSGQVRLYPTGSLASIQQQREDVISWPTPDASQRGARSRDLVINQSTVKRRTSGQKRGIDLQTAVKFNPTKFPTPQARDWKGECGRGAKGMGVEDLPGFVKDFPTPQASDNRDRGNMSNPSIQRRVRIGKQLGLSQSVHPTNGKLNPDWVEFLMGWPASWTDLTSTGVVQYPLSPEPEGLPRVCESNPTRTPRLKCIGNGQVPQCAATAYQLLLERFNEQP
jgi:hypothetical protein